MTVRAERLTVDECMRDRIDGLGLGEATVAHVSHARTMQAKRGLQQLRYDGSAGHLDEHDVVETDAVERVQEGKATLNFVRLDHALEDVTDRQRLALTGEVVRNRKNGAKIVGRVTPYNMHSVRPRTHGRRLRATHTLQRGNSR